MQKQLVNARQVAEMLGVSTSTIYSWKNKGYIKPVMITPTKMQFYDLEEIQAFMNSMYVSNENKG